ncbi:MAG: M48 family metallopeptidase [Pirellulaceae bacterium]|jgi:STE24 endopeptidase|nr:M48 family metallopeptidase [Pirellulaceae bacterium]
MQLSLLLAVVAALVCAQHAPSAPAPGALPRLALTLASGTLVVLLAVASSQAVARGLFRDPAQRPAWRRRFARLRQLHTGLWLLSVVGTLALFDWPQVVRYNWGLAHLILVKDVLVLVPVWLPLVCSWAAFYDVARADAVGQLPSAGAAESSAPHPLGTRWEFVWLHARHYLGLSLLPVLVLLACQDVLTLLLPAWEETAVAWWGYLVPLAAITVAFPWLLSRIWKTSPLPDSDLRQRLLALTRQMGIRCRDFRVWQTNNQILNAAVAGLLPAARYVFVTDGLLTFLRDDELEAVVAHELGHARRRHLWLRLALVGLPLWIVAQVRAWSPESVRVIADWQAAQLSDSPVVLHLAVAGLFCALAAAALGRYSRLLEHDADLCVWEVGHGATFVTAIDRLSYLCHERRHRATWLHPSTAARVELLQRALQNPRAAYAYRRRVARINGLLLAVWLLTPAGVALL